MVGICALAFAIRLVPIWKKRWFGNDSYYHLLVSRAWRANHKYPRTDPNLLPTNANTYPPLLQVFMAPFASLGDRIAMTIVSPLFDTATIILLFAAGEWIHIGQPLLPPLIYAVSANNLLDASTLNPRPLGNLFLVAAALSLLSYSGNGSLIVYALLILMESLVLLSHKLSVQLMVPLVIIVSIVMMFDPANPVRSIPMLGSLPLAIVVATALTGGAYIRKILPDHLHYIAVHLRQGEYRTGARRMPSPVNLFKGNPIVFIAPFLGFYLYFANKEFSSVPNLLYGLWLPWSTITLVLAQFWVWGDSWRYLQLGTFPSAVIVVSFITNDGFTENLDKILLILLVLALAAIAFIQVRAAIERDNASKIAKILESMPEEWRKTIKGRRIYSNVQHYIVPYLTGSSVLLGSPSAAGMKASFRVSQLSKGGLRDIEEFASKELQEPLDFALILNDFPGPSGKGYVPSYQSESVIIYRLSTQ